MSRAQPEPLRELAGTLAHELDEQGVPSALHLDGFPAPRPDRVYVWLDPRGYLHAEGAAATPEDSVLRRTVFLYDEHRAPVRDEDHLDLARRAGAVFALDTQSAVALHRLGVPARVMRPGYSAALDHFDPGAARPIDVMFLGAHSLRRTRQLNRAARVLSRYRCRVMVGDPSPGPGHAGPLPAQRKWLLLAQTKVLLNLHCGEGSDLEWRRVLDAIHAGAVVVSEHSTALSPLVAGEHLLVASADALPFVAEMLLRDPERLAAMRDRAHERLSAWMPFSLPVSVLRAALVELVGAPVDSGARLGRLAPGTAATAASPVAPAVSPSPTDAEAVQGAELSQGAEAVQFAEVVHESPASRRLSAPRVTVVTALGDATYAAAMATLDTVLAGRLNELELVVVDDGSPAATVSAALEWLRSHPELAWRLVRSRGARVTSAGAARDAGLTVARAPYTLVLDAGQELYPRCLGELVGALEQDGAAFAYPIQEVTGDPDGFVAAGGDYLMSFGGWDPARLRAGNPVHAPALVRTERLREIGGYATDARLHGLEDYDLWCRMAERGWSGRLVAQPLARRSESGDSPVLRCMRPACGPAAAALTQRAPRTLAGAFFSAGQS